MTEREVATATAERPEHRFWLLLIALTALLVGYPYFEDTRAGAFAGGITALAALTAGVYAHRANRWIFRIAAALALASVAASVRAFLWGVRGDAIVEGTFTAFYAFMTVSVFLEFVRTRRVTSDTMYGAVCVYLLVGLTFANLYDLIETLQPGSFQVNVDAPLEIRWRTLVFFSFMTLTTVGLGDVTPATTQTQSLASIEGVMGVLYVALLVARIVGIYSRRQAEE